MLNWRVRTPLTVVGCVIFGLACIGTGLALMSSLQGTVLVLACIGGGAVMVVGVGIVVREMRRT